MIRCLGAILLSAIATTLAFLCWPLMGISKISANYAEQLLAEHVSIMKAKINREQKDV